MSKDKVRLRPFAEKCSHFLRKLALTIFLPMALTGPSMSEDLSSFETHFNSIFSLKSIFEQTNSDGSVSNGRIWLKKPGKIRFEYDNPGSLLVIANSGFLTVIDRISNTPPQRYFTKQTPLSFLVKENIIFSETNFKLFLKENEKRANLEVLNTDPRNLNNLVLHFKLDPIEISGWTLETSAGEKIKVDLIESEFNAVFEEDLLFGIGGEIQKHMKKISN